MSIDEAVTYIVITIVPLAMVSMGIWLSRRDWRITKNRKNEEP